ncbi:MAG: hypothetical protein GEV11_25655 [Streptosporangiales bacterium]|nr:hypothetical protein [Streptosporangiales bacterium]
MRRPFVPRPPVPALPVEVVACRCPWALAALPAGRGGRRPFVRGHLSLRRRSGRSPVAACGLLPVHPPVVAHPPFVLGRLPPLRLVEAVTCRSLWWPAASGRCRSGRASRPAGVASGRGGAGLGAVGWGAVGWGGQVVRRRRGGGSGRVVDQVRTVRRKAWTTGEGSWRRGAGAVYPVNPRRDSVQGLTAYPDVAAVPGEIDLAVATPAATVRETVAACGAKGVRVCACSPPGSARWGRRDGGRSGRSPTSPRGTPCASSAPTARARPTSRPGPSPPSPPASPTIT